MLLEEKSLDCQLEDSEGRTGLMVAAMEGRLGVVKLILRYCTFLLVHTHRGYGIWYMGNRKHICCSCKSK